jgi:hypothetical protein
MENVRKRRRWIALALVTVVLLVAIIALVLWFTILNREKPVQSTSRAPILITILSPTSGASYPQNGWVPLQIVAYSEEPLTTLELWDNDQLAGTEMPVGVDDPTHFIFNWHWSITTAGTHTLVIRGLDTGGQAGFSNAVRIETSPAVGMIGIYNTGEGDTLESIASKFNLDIESLAEHNPGFSAGGDIPPGTSVDLPIVPPGNNPAAPASLPSPAQTVGAPSAPLLLGEIQDCSALLTITDNSDNEDGFVVYRLSASSSTFQAIATLPAHRSQQTISLTDGMDSEDQEYYIAAFNQIGETHSNLLILAAPASCPAGENSPGLSLSDGVLTLPEPVQLAYLYASINRGAYFRFPENPDFFLPVIQRQVDLNPYLQGALSDQLIPPYTLDLEAWGWGPGGLTYLGDLHSDYDLTVLKVCPLASSCMGEAAANLGDETTIAPDDPDTSREFKWTTSLPHNTTGLLQLATTPLPEDFQVSPSQLVKSIIVTASWFDVDFSGFAPPLPESTPTALPPGTLPPDQDQGFMYDLFYTGGISFMIHSSFYMALGPTNYYARITPLQGDQPAGAPSNMVVIHYTPYSDSTIAHYQPQDIYDIEIVDFDGFRRPYLLWGCVIVKGVDPNASSFQSGFWQTYLSFYQNHLQSGEPICPLPYQEPEKPWYEEVWDFFSGALSWLAQTWSSIKNAVIQNVAGLLNGIHPGLCPSECQTGLTAALNAGLAALGIPPELPDLTQLTEEGVLYLAEEGARIVGVDCDETCQDLLRKGIEELVEQNNEAQINAFVNTDEAHAHGVEPLLLPPDGLDLVPAPGSKWQPAHVSVRITRKPDSGDLDPDLLDYYRMNISVTGYNDTLTGQNIFVPTAWCFTDYSMYPCGEVPIPVTAALEGPLFKNAVSPIIALQPGESRVIEYPLPFQSEYWAPGHNDYRMACPGCDDWNFLYYNGQAIVKAWTTCDQFDQKCGVPDEKTFPVPLP